MYKYQVQVQTQIILKQLALEMIKDIDMVATC